MRLRVIGVGSPHGDDAVGLAVAERLARRALPADVEVLARPTPGLGLVDDLRGADAVVLVDALRGEGPPGAVRDVDPAELARSRAWSSHGHGVAEALALASALEARPARLRIIGVEASAAAGPALSRAVRAAVTPACRRVLAQIEALRRAPPDADPR